MRPETADSASRASSLVPLASSNKVHFDSIGVAAVRTGIVAFRAALDYDEDAPFGRFVVIQAGTGM